MHSRYGKRKKKAASLQKPQIKPPPLHSVQHLVHIKNEDSNAKNQNIT